MHPLAVLRYCREVLSERQRRDSWQGWYWGLRRKIVNYLIAGLERDLAGDQIPELTVAERDLLRESHPLLSLRAGPGTEFRGSEPEWLAELRVRVQRYVDSCKRIG
ncbi:MAG: hypothetical protein JSS02_20500 [Planctomycetes bacterium]|nr:hypothetical protein [Planctomycetota bacterium]